MYKTIQNLIEIGLASKEELAEAYAQYIFENGKRIQEPKEYWYHNGEKYSSTNINSLDFLFYKAVKSKEKRLM